MGTESGFSLQFLGSGNAWSKPPINFNNNLLLSVGGARWLIDCGSLCPLALHEMGYTPGHIEGVCITHLHGDHINGLEELFFYNYFHLGGRRVELRTPRDLFTKYSGIEGEDLWENCLRGTFEYVAGEDRRVVLEDFAGLGTYANDEIFEIHGLRLRFFPVQHVPGKPCFGIVFDERIFYTSDCVFSLPQIESFLAQGAQLIFHDVCFKEQAENGVHASFSQLSQLPRPIAEKIVLMHYDDATTAQDFAKARDCGFRVAGRGQQFSF